MRVVEYRGRIVKVKACKRCSSSAPAVDIMFTDPDGLYCTTCGKLWTYAESFTTEERYICKRCKQVTGFIVVKYEFFETPNPAWRVICSHCYHTTDVYADIPFRGVMAIATTSEKRLPRVVI